tara:strand:- start:52447 stop:54903 length:2457 start_codon:yes stop_codon:yes gene_type:complete
MATAAERTQLIQLMVGMAGAAPGADILAELEATFDSGVSLTEIAEAVTQNPLYNGDTGLYPEFLPNAVFATNYVTDLIGGEVSATVLAEGISIITGLLNGGSSRGEVVMVALNFLAGLDEADPDYGAAAAAFNNKTAVAEYYSVTVAQSGAGLTLAQLQAIVDNVDSTAGSVIAANGVIDAAIPPVPFDMLGAFAALEAAEDGISAFLAGAAATETQITAAVGAADTAYDAAIDAVLGGAASMIGVETPATTAANLAGAQGIAGADLADAQGVLTVAEGALAAVPGLAAAIATAASAATAEASAIGAAAAALVTQNSEFAALEVAAVANTDVDAIGLGAGALTVTLNAGAALVAAGATVDLAVVDFAGMASLATANVAWSPAQQTEFAELQATAGVADTIAAFNARVAADGASANATTASDDADFSRDFLDFDTADGAAVAALAALGAAIPTAASAASPTEAEIEAELTALEAIETAAVAVQAGTQAALTAASDARSAATAATVVADADLTAASAAAVGAETDGATLETITANLVVAADGTVTADLQTSGNSPIIVLEAGNLVLAPGIVSNPLLAALLAASVANEAADAALILANDAWSDANDANNDAMAASAAASADVTVFEGLITTVTGLNNAAPLQAGLAGPQAGVTGAQGIVDAIGAAVTGRADANVLADQLTALQAVLTGAEGAFTTAGFSTPEDIDAAAEFATAVDDIFAVGTTDSFIYNFNLQGSDTIYVGTDHTANTTDIGAGFGQTLLTAAGDDSALEIFLEDTGANVVIHIEQEVWGSSAGNNTTEITLIGVASVADVTIADGFVTVA